ncbi:hypothetical protein HK101_006403 [Irineochytrium annulatum]|nr:hypothetical protein HK101_006403 [Irineochytrium annulatum]
MDSVDPHAIIGTTLVDATGKTASRIVSLIGSGSFAHVYLAEDALAPTGLPSPVSPTHSPLGGLDTVTGHMGTVHQHFQQQPPSPAANSIDAPTVATSATTPGGSTSGGDGPQRRAVKRLFKRGLDARQLMLQRQEAAIMRQLADHTNIVGLIATVEDDDCLYLIMEYCELDLYEAITQQGGFPEDVVKEVFGQIADAVQYCHSKGYYHRDLKPENCLISTADYKIKLADFGLATTDTWSTEMGCGSVRYMAPECFEAGHNSTDPAIVGPYTLTGPDGQPVVGYAPAANDVWALGVILLNLLFGKNPWFEAFPTDAIFSAFSGQNPNVLRQQFDLSPHFDSVLRRAFDLDPRRRCTISDLKALIDALPRFVGGSVPPVIPTTPNLPHIIAATVGAPGCYGLVLPQGVPIPAGYPSPAPSGRQSRRRRSLSRPLSVATSVSSSIPGTTRLSSAISWDRSGVSADGSFTETNLRSARRAAAEVDDDRDTATTAARMSTILPSASDEFRYGEDYLEEEDDAIMLSPAASGRHHHDSYAENVRDRMHVDHADRMLGLDDESIDMATVAAIPPPLASERSGSPATESGSVIVREDAVVPAGAYQFDAQQVISGFKDESEPGSSASANARRSDERRKSLTHRLSASFMSVGGLSRRISSSTSSALGQQQPAAPVPAAAPNNNGARVFRGASIIERVQKRMSSGSLANAFALHSGAPPSPPVSPPTTPARNSGTVAGPASKLISTEASSSTSPRTRDSGYDSGERRSAKRSQPFRQALNGGLDEEEELSESRGGPMRADRGLVEREVIEALNQLSGKLADSAETVQQPTPPVTPPPTRRSRSPRMWFAPLMKREAVVAGGLPKASSGRLFNHGFGRYAQGGGFRRQASRTDLREDAANAAASSPSGSPPNGGLVAPVMPQFLRKKRSARWLGVNRDDETASPSNDASRSATPSGSLMADSVATAGNADVSSSRASGVGEDGNGRRLPKKSSALSLTALVDFGKSVKEMVVTKQPSLKGRRAGSIDNSGAGSRDSSMNGSAGNHSGHTSGEASTTGTTGKIGWKGGFGSLRRRITSGSLKGNSASSVATRILAESDPALSMQRQSSSSSYGASWTNGVTDVLPMTIMAAPPRGDSIGANGYHPIVGEDVDVDGASNFPQRRSRRTSAPPGAVPTWKDGVVGVLDVMEDSRRTLQEAVEVEGDVAVAAAAEPVGAHGWGKFSGKNWLTR